MDIEGAEQQVLEELDMANKLHLINYLIIEVHEARAVDFNNSLTTICNILINNNFALEITPAHDLQNAPKATICNWVNKVKPKLSMIRAKNLKYRHNS